MRPSITWYDILDALPDAPPEDIQRAYLAKAGLLRPELLSGAPPKVVKAAARAQGIIDAAWRILGDPVNRQRYDETAGLWRSGRGSGQRGNSFAESDPVGFDFTAGNEGAQVLSGLTALNLWLAEHPDRPGRIPVPDVRGLFYDVFLEVVGRLELHTTFVQLTKHPLPVDGLVVEQSPAPATRIHRLRAELTVQVWHPPSSA